MTSPTHYLARTSGHRRFTLPGPGRSRPGTGVARRDELPPRAEETLCVNHYSFHILDRDWGHVTIKIRRASASSHSPSDPEWR